MAPRPAGEAIGDRGGTGRAVVGGDLRAEAALLEHEPVKRQRQIAGQLALEERHARRALHRERRGHRGHDLEARERFPRARPPAPDGGHGHVADIRGRAEPEHDAVGDLAGQLQHLRAEPGQEDGRGLGQAGQAALPARAIARAGMLHLAGERRPQHRHVLAHHVERPAHVEAEARRPSRVHGSRRCPGAAAHARSRRG